MLSRIFLFRSEDESSRRSCVVTKYQPAVAMWYYPLLAREASLGGNKANPTKFSCRKTGFVAWRPSNDKIIEVPFLQD